MKPQSAACARISPPTSGIARVALADRLPLMWNGHHVIEVDTGGEGPADERLVGAHLVSTAAVEPDFFTAFDAAPIAGRLLGHADNADVARVAVVNESFVRNVLGGRNAIGRRLKYRASSNGGQLIPQQQWIEIVGVVRDLGMGADPAAERVRASTCRSICRRSRPCGSRAWSPAT